MILFKKILIDLLKEFKIRPTQPLMHETSATLENMLFLSIYLKPESPTSLIDASILNLMDDLPEDSRIYQIVFLIKQFKRNSITNEEVRDLLLKIKQSLPCEIKIYLTYLFAQKYNNFKSIFLYEHYKLLRFFMGENQDILENKKLDDSALEIIFKSSIILYVCGYNKSIRLSYQEKLNYLESNISDETLVNKFRNAYDESFKIKIKNIKKFNLLFLFCIAIVLIVIDIFWRIKLPPV